MARASWRPVRSSDSAPRPARSAAEREQSRASSRVQIARYQDDESLPPPSTSQNSVMETPIPEGEPLDGQVVLHPLHDNVVDGHAFPLEASCGCEQVGCDGIGCDSFDACDGGCDAACGYGELCGPDTWRPCLTLCLPQDGWATFEYLAWWQDGMSLPPLVTSNVGTGIAGTDAGVLGRASTVTRFGGDRVVDDAFDGGRLRFGFWLDRQHTWGIGAEYFSLGTQSDQFRATSTGEPTLARPFFNTETGVEDSSLVAFPDLISGTLGVSAESQLDGWGVHFRRLRNREGGRGSGLFLGAPDRYCDRTEMLVGYRGMQLDEQVRIAEDSVSSNQEQFDIFDRFDTRNQFNGADIGWIYERTRGYWTYDASLRMALGNTRQTVTIDGQTTLSDPNDPPAQTLPGGVLAQPSNMGTHRQNEFTVVPEINANIRFQLTDHLRMTFGYSFIYWSNIVRPGDHISRDLNPEQLPPAVDPLTGSSRPEFNWDTTDYWVQGINVGGEYRW